MAYDYDKLYKSTPQALGQPTQIFVGLFERCEGATLRVLDVGCGQGRDALFIARMGHTVVGVDFSPNGIRDMVDAANREKLSVEGVIADIKTFTPRCEIDVLLFDRTLHMLSENDRLDALARLIGHVATGGWVLIADERSNIQGFKSVFQSDDASWDTEFERRGYLFLRRS